MPKYNIIATADVCLSGVSVKDGDIVGTLESDHETGCVIACLKTHMMKLETVETTIAPADSPKQPAPAKSAAIGKLRTTTPPASATGGKR